MSDARLWPVLFWLSFILLTAGCGRLSHIPADEMFKKSEIFRGSLVLTAEEASQAVPFTLTLDGKPATSLGGSLVEAQVVAFGQRSATGEVMVIEKTIDNGEGVVLFDLVDDLAAPVEVQWSIQARTSGRHATEIFGRSTPARTPVLAVERIASRRVDPVSLETVTSIGDEVAIASENVMFNIDWGTTRNVSEPTATRLSFTVNSPEPLSIVVPAQHNSSSNRHHVQLTELTVDGDQRVEVWSGSTATITPPVRCEQASPCRFDVVALSELAADVALEVRGSEPLEVVATAEPPLVLTVVELPVQNFVLAESDDAAVFDLKVDLTGDATTGLVWITPRRTSSGPPVRLQRKDGYHFLANCCPAVVELHRRDRTEEDAGFELSATVEIWANAAVVVNEVALLPSE